MSKRTASTKPEAAATLPQTWEPSSQDVICARGKVAAEHVGNQRLKALVQCHLTSYAASRCKFQKSKIVSQIVATVRRESPGGGFVKFVDDHWVCVNDRHAREKVGQLFRDQLGSKYKSSTTAKARNRREKSVGSESDNDSHSEPSFTTRFAARSNTIQPVAAFAAAPLVARGSAQPLPERPPSMINIKNDSMTSSSFHNHPIYVASNMMTATTERATPNQMMWKTEQLPHDQSESGRSHSNFQFPLFGHDSNSSSGSEDLLPEITPLGLPNFEPLNIGESTADDLFGFSNASAHQQPAAAAPAGSNGEGAFSQSDLDNLYDFFTS